jgi:glutamine synthetase
MNSPLHERGSAMLDHRADTERLIFVGTSDLAGLVRGKAFPAADLEKRVVSGVGLTGSNIMISAFGPIYATPFGTLGDLKLVPDMNARARVPLADGGETELVLGDIRSLDGADWPACPRAFLRRGLDALEGEFGLRLLAAFEHEFVYTGVAEQPGSSYSFDRFRRAGRFGGRALATLRSARIIPDSFLPEYGERQFEVTVKPRRGMRAADDAVLLREIFRACAAAEGARATFAPVLEPDGIGNGTHIHFSLHDCFDHPVMYDAAGPYGISSIGGSFVGGIIQHMPALTALTAPSVASFFRLRPNKWAPTWANIGDHDRGASLRVCPIFEAGADAAQQFNIEYRIGDATASPYLALGAIVHAGLDGLRRALPLPDHPQGGAPDFAAAGVQPLPRSLAQALDLLEASPVAATWFGDEFRSAYLLFKRSEIAAVAHLTDEAICERYAQVY